MQREIVFCGDGHLYFQRTLPSRVSSTMIPESASLLPDFIGTFEIAALFGGVALGDQMLRLLRRSGRGFSGPKPSWRSFSSSSSLSTARIASNFSIAATMGGASCCRNSPRSMAVLTSRTKSKIEPPARRRYSDRPPGPRRNQPGPACARSSIFGFVAAGKLFVFQARDEIAQPFDGIFGLLQRCPR